MDVNWKWDLIADSIPGERGGFMASKVLCSGTFTFSLAVDDVDGEEEEGVGLDSLECSDASLFVVRTELKFVCPPSSS